MSQTRREFIAVTSAAVAATAFGLPRDGWAASQPLDPPLDLIGDPYLATVDHPGLGGRSYDDALERALRFRSNDAERDRYVLGLEF